MEIRNVLIKCTKHLELNVLFIDYNYTSMKVFLLLCHKDQLLNKYIVAKKYSIFFF